MAFSEFSGHGFSLIQASPSESKRWVNQADKGERGIRLLVKSLRVFLRSTIYFNNLAAYQRKRLTSLFFWIHYHGSILWHQWRPHICSSLWCNGSSPSTHAHHLTLVPTGPRRGLVIAIYTQNNGALLCHLVGRSQREICSWTLKLASMTSR